MRLSTLSILLVIGSTLVLSSCKKIFIPSDEDSKYNTFKGPEVKVGDGHARTFATISRYGVPQEIGVIFTEEALSGLPDENTLYTLDFHRKAIEATPFEHVLLGLNQSGHPLPPSGHIAAHFDVRFMMMTEKERLAIPAPPASGFDAPPPGYLPANYFQNIAVAQIGRHWTYITDAVTTVNHTMVLGTWNGELNFINPIVTLTTLASGASYSIAYPQPQFFAEHGYYPTKYNIYEDDKGMHYVTLSNFVRR